MIVLPNMGLVKWDTVNDNFSHEQLAANWTAVDEHDHTVGKGKSIPYGGLAEQSVGPENIREGVATAVAEQIHIPIKWYGPKVIAPEETRENTVFGKLPTADEVSGVVVAANQLVLVAYSALTKPSVTGAGRAAIFIGSNQLKIPSTTFTVPAVVEASSSTNEGFATLSSQANGLISSTGGNAFVTTGMVLSATESKGGFTIVQRLAAGTYAFSVQYRSTSGSYAAKERILWVGVLG